MIPGTLEILSSRQLAGRSRSRVSIQQALSENCWVSALSLRYRTVARPEARPAAHRCPLQPPVVTSLLWSRPIPPTCVLPAKDLRISSKALNAATSTLTRAEGLPLLQLRL